MYYSILIYGAEDVVERLSEVEEEAVLQKHRELQAELKKDGRFGAAIRLMSTAAAVSVRGDASPPLITDGPFAETKEQLLGLYLIDCASLEEAIEAAKKLPLQVGTIEVRPVEYLDGGTDKPNRA